MAATSVRRTGPARHWLAAGAAMLLSAGVHFAAVEFFPAFPVGGAPERDRPKLPREVMRLGEVRPRPVRPAEPPEAFRPSRPDARGLAQEASEYLASVEAAVAPYRPVELPPSPPPAPALTDADAVTATPSRWEPRQDVFLIEHGRYAEDLRAAPRRYINPDLRAPAAPDIVPPAWSGELARAAPPRSLDADTIASALDMPVAPSLELASVPSLDPGGAAPADLAREVGALSDETAVDPAAPADPVEHLLDLDVALFRAADAPGETFFRIRIARRAAAALPVLPRDLLLLQDCSESMTQRKLNDCKAGLRAIVEDLAPGDRFDLVSFRERTERCFGRMREATLQARAASTLCIDSLEARGKTDVYAGLRELMDASPEPARPFIAILITDGRPTSGVVDSSEIIERFTRANEGRISVFAVGGGRRVNRFLLDLLSYRNRGDSVVVEDRRDLEAAMSDLGRALARPVLANLGYRFAGGGDLEIYPRTLTHLYLDRPLVLYGRFAGPPPRTAVRITGAGADGPKDMVFDIDWAGAETGDLMIRTDWAYHKVYDLVGRHIETGRDAPLDEAHALADRFGLPMPYGRDVVLR